MAQYLKHLINLILVHISRVLLKTFNQLSDDLLQIFFVLLRKLAKKVKDVLHEVAVPEVERIDQLLKHISLAID